jgi:hypothetical protein
MKGVVLDIVNKKALILQEDGTVASISNHGYRIGDEIVFRKVSTPHLNWVAALAASFILLFTVTIYAYYAPAAYISIDVNPSVELTINAFSRVIHVQAMDEPSQLLTNALDLRNRYVDDAVQLTIRQMDSLSVFSKNETNYLLVSVAAKNQLRAQEILQKVVNTVSASSTEADLDIEVQEALISLEYAQRARDLGTTPGKLRLIQFLRESTANPDAVTDSDWIDKPVREIMHQIHRNRSDSANKKPTQEDNNLRPPASDKNESLNPSGPQIPDPSGPNPDDDTTDQLNPSSQFGKQKSR